MEHVTEWQASTTNESHTVPRQHPAPPEPADNRATPTAWRGLFRVLPERSGLTAPAQLPGVQGW